MTERTGKRKPRGQFSNRRIPELGYYFIVTDAEETEPNYMLGLRDSIPKNLQGKLVIQVCTVHTAELVDKALEKSSALPQFSELWIVFDRDQVKDFDQIVALAEKKGVKVGWSNPCIEVWFNAYLDKKMPTSPDSISCCRDFKERYMRITEQEYKKSDSNIYKKLCHHGDEKRAIKIAEKRHRELEANCDAKPSEMSPCTTLYLLVKEIKEKTEENSHTGS